MQEMLHDLALSYFILVGVFAPPSYVEERLATMQILTQSKICLKSGSVQI